MFSFLILVLAGCSQKGNPQDAKNSSDRDRKSAPQEITDVCSGKSEGDSCEIAMPSRDGKNSQNVSGTCKKGPSGDQLRCMGQGSPGGSRGSGGPGVSPGEKSDDINN